jgi:hypothetical protein
MGKNFFVEDLKSVGYRGKNRQVRLQQPKSFFAAKEITE